MLDLTVKKGMNQDVYKRQDEAMLTKNNINTFGAEEHIVYKRQKTQNAKKVKPITIPVTPAIREQLEWFKANTTLTGDYLLPIITRDYEGKQLYDHIRSRYKRINDGLKQLGKFPCSLKLKNIPSPITRWSISGIPIIIPVSFRLRVSSLSS